MRCPRLIHRQPDSAAHSPPSRNLQDQGISRAKPLASWRKARSLLRTDLPRLVREHVISMDQLTVMFINTNGTVGHPHTGIEGR
jgi:hypothetical protein